MLLSACAMPPTTPAMQQVAAQPETPEQAHKRYCKGLMGAALMQPTLSGRNGEGWANAAAAYNSCMAGLPPPETPLQKQQRTTTHTTCQQGMMGKIECTSTGGGQQTSNTVCRADNMGGMKCTSY